MQPIIPICVGATVVLAWFLMQQRSHMLARANTILKQMTDPEVKVEYLRFDSCRPRMKKEALQTRIDSAAAEGWTFLKASRAPLKTTIQSLGGGLNLHFVRERPKAQQETTPAH